MYRCLLLRIHVSRHLPELPRPWGTDGTTPAAVNSTRFRALPSLSRRPTSHAHPVRCFCVLVRHACVPIVIIAIECAVPHLALADPTTRALHCSPLSTMPPLRLNAVAFVSPQNHPILIRSFAQGQDELKYHYIAHTSLDVIDERSASPVAS